MRTLLTLLRQVTLLAFFLPTILVAQAPPSDFHFSATSGGIAPWSHMVSIAIDSSGNANYLRAMTGGPPTILAQSAFTISSTGLQQLWQTIQDSGFFSLNPLYSDTTVRDGMFARISVTANGVTHQVRIKNTVQPEIQAIIQILNAIVPDSLRLPYSPPYKYNYSPQDPCTSFFGSVVNPRIDAMIRSSPDMKTRLFPGPNPRAMGAVANVDLSHPGTVVAYNESLQDAVAHGWANLTSKGDFFGDDVSITIDDRNLSPRPNTISITLFLEFWGPLATEANINAICLDIASKWDGVTTSGGQEVQMGFVTQANPGATSPPNTPGFHEIDLVPLDSIRSDVEGDPGVNTGTGSGTWEVGAPAGTYGHEAGHLMGLPDRYTDYNKQSDGSWKNSETGQSYPDDNSFANYVHTKYPSDDINSIKDFLHNNDTYSVPNDGSENDLMADVSKKPTQSDIDQITAHPGLLVNVPSGTPLVNRASDEQDLVITRSDDIFVPQGQERTLNGVYAACIDHFLSVPSTGGVFDVAPALSQWAGISAAQYMSTLLHFVDSARLYCDLDITTQEAIWRISDNSTALTGSDVDTLFSDAGIALTDQILDFPRLDRNSSTDTMSHLFVPNLLYVAKIFPAFSTGQIGKVDTLHVHLSHPVGTPAPVGISWSANGPGGASVPVVAGDSSASLTPTRSGVFQVSVGLAFNDTLHGQTTVPSNRGAYVIVPDDYTETFEHPGLTDKYPWASYGTVPWTITGNVAETGHFSAQPGLVANGQSSTLGIDVMMPTGDSIIYSMRSMTDYFTDHLEFAIDSIPTGIVGESFDWTVQSQYVPAGKHRLTLTYTNSSATPMSNVWLDNIFFPGNVVVTSAGGSQQAVPSEFALEQNYPNPFNPTTTIAYELPKSSPVTLTVYDILGRQVETLVNEIQQPGRYDVQFDGSHLASGVYFYRLQAGNFVQTRRLILLK